MWTGGPSTVVTPVSPRLFWCLNTFSYKNITFVQEMSGTPTSFHPLQESQILFSTKLSCGHSDRARNTENVRKGERDWKLFSVDQPT